jgi:hypothetical protein
VSTRMTFGLSPRSVEPPNATTPPVYTAVPSTAKYAEFITAVGQPE